MSIKVQLDISLWVMSGDLTCWNYWSTWIIKESQFHWVLNLRIKRNEFTLQWTCKANDTLCWPKVHRSPLSQSPTSSTTPDLRPLLHIHTCIYKPNIRPRIIHIAGIFNYLTASQLDKPTLMANTSIETGNKVSYTSRLCRLKLEFPN